MTARHHRPPLASSSVVRDQPERGCANCGRLTTDTVVGESLSVAARDGGRRLAPPMPLCETCRRDVIYRRGWLPTWCTACQSWQPFGHNDGHLVAVRALPADTPEPGQLVQAV